MVYLNIAAVILGLIIVLKDFPKFRTKWKRKLIIIFAISILVSGINILDIVYTRYEEGKKATELRQVNNATSYEVQRLNLIIMGLTDSQIESLGKKPLLKLYYNWGQEYKRTGNFKEAIESYERILKFHLTSNVDKVSAYNLVGNCYFDLYEIEIAMQSFQKALEIVKNIKDEKDRSNGRMITFHNIGCVYIELAQWKDAQKYLEYSLEESVKLDNYLRKANTLLNISNIYFQLNIPKITIEKLFQSIQTLQEALKVYTPEDFPMNYAITQNNLGAAYGTLADVEDKAGNCNKAIQAYQESLKVYNPEDFSPWTTP